MDCKNLNFIKNNESCLENNENREIFDNDNENYLINDENFVESEKNCIKNVKCEKDDEKFVKNEEKCAKIDEKIDCVEKLINLAGNFDKNRLLHAREESSLSLAFLGDSVWTLLVRDYFCQKTTFKNNNLHKLCTKFVKASFQAKAVEKIMDKLTDEEMGVFRRARNTKMATVSKNSTLADYKYATGFEAILGYHYLTGNFERLKWVFRQFLCEFDKILENYEKGARK